jgi:DNA replication protein DnaD
MITLSNEQNSYEEEIDNEAEGVTTSMEYQTQLTEELRNANMLQYVPRFLITQKDPFAFMKCKV